MRVAQVFTILLLSKAIVSLAFPMNHLQKKIRNQQTLSISKQRITAAMKLNHFIHGKNFQRQKWWIFSHNEDYVDTILSAEDGSTYINHDLFKKICQNLKILPVLSFLSGLSPAVKIIAQSHVSRMPDCSIAHDIDTLLLWPAVMDESRGVVSTTIFQAPVAAVTDVSLYDVDWVSVQSAYMSAVFQSLLCSFVLAVSLYTYLNSPATNNGANPKEK